MKLEFDKYINRNNYGNGKLTFTNKISESSNINRNFIKSTNKILFVTKISNIKNDNEIINGDNKFYIFDTSAPMILLSKQLIYRVKQIIEKNNKICFLKNIGLLCYRKNRNFKIDFKNIYINLNGIEYILTPNEYISRKVINNGRINYILRFVYSNTGIIGLPFFQNIISYFDYLDKGIILIKKNQTKFNLIEK